MRCALLWAWERATYRAWALTGYAPGRLSGLHYEAERRLRNEENR